MEHGFQHNLLYFKYFNEKLLGIPNMRCRGGDILHAQSGVTYYMTVKPSGYA
jgi:hypothetical protein